MSRRSSTPLASQAASNRRSSSSPRTGAGSFGTGGFDALHGDVDLALHHQISEEADTWGPYGVSAVVAADDDEIDTLCETKLNAWAVIVVFSRSDLEQAGVEVVPTFGSPM